MNSIICILLFVVSQFCLVPRFLLTDLFNSSIIPTEWNLYKGQEFIQYKNTIMRTENRKFHFLQRAARINGRTISMNHSRRGGTQSLRVMLAVSLKLRLRFSTFSYRPFTGIFNVRITEEWDIRFKQIFYRISFGFEFGPLSHLSVFGKACL